MTLNKNLQCAANDDEQQNFGYDANICRPNLPKINVLYNNNEKISLGVLPIENLLCQGLPI